MPITTSLPLSLSLYLSREVSRSHGTHELRKRRNENNVDESSLDRASSALLAYQTRRFIRHTCLRSSRTILYEASWKFRFAGRHEETRLADKSYRAALVFIDRAAAAGKSERITPRRPFY